MIFLVTPTNDLDVTPDGVCGILSCDAVACGMLQCVSYCDCRSAVSEPWGNGESLF